MGSGTYSDPEYPGASIHAWECVPHPRRETACGDGGDAEEIDAEADVVHCVRVVGEYMVRDRAGVAEETTEKKQSEHDPVVAVGGGVMFFRVRVVDDWEKEHPDGGGEMAVDVTGLVVDVEEAAETADVGIGYWAVAGVDVFVVFGPFGLVLY